MPNPFSRLKMELEQLRNCLEPKDFRRYLWYLTTKAPSWIGAKTLVPVDHSMSGNVPFRVVDQSIVIPLDEIKEVLSSHDPTPTFGAAREMYASNVYLRAFRKGLKARTVVDLGSNRGLMLILAAKVLRAKQGVGVEPEDYFGPVFDLLIEANNLQDANLCRIKKFASAKSDPNTVTVQQIMDEHNIFTIDFLKCDIEGGEFDVYLSNNRFFNNVNNIAMELHPAKGDISLLVKELKKFDFIVRVTDQFGAPTEEKKGLYLYASRTGDLSGGDH